MPTCSLKHCFARKATNPGLTLHRLPTNKIMKQKWLDIIGAENLNPTVKQWRVCSKHFEESCINRTLEVPRLKDGAMPSSSLLPKPISPPIQSTTNTFSHKTKKTTSCENLNGSRSPSPMQTDMSEDSAPEDTLVEQPINPSGWVAAYTTFAQAWAPVMDPLAPMPIGRSKTMDLPAPTVIAPSKNKRNSQEYLHTIQRQNNKIKNLTRQCQTYKRKIKCLSSKIRTRDKRITQLTYVIKKLKENICFNNEGAIILEETEVPEHLAEDFNIQIPYFDHNYATHAGLSMDRSSDAEEPLPSRPTTPDPPLSEPSTNQLPFEVLNLNALKSHENTNLSKETTSKELMLVVSPLTINRKTRKTMKRTDLNKKAKSNELSVKVSSLNSKNTLKPQDSTDLTKEAKSKDLMVKVSPLNSKKTTKPQDSTDLTKEAKSKELMVKVSPLNSKKTTKPQDSTDLTKEAKSKEMMVKVSPLASKKTRKPQDITDLVKEAKSKELRVNVSSLTSKNTLKSQKSTDLIKPTKSKELMAKVSAVTSKNITNSHKSTDLTKELTSTHSSLTMSPLTKKNTLKPQESTDVTKKTTPKELMVKVTRLSSKNLIKPHDSTDIIKDTNSKELKVKVSPISSKNTLKSHESTDLNKQVISTHSKLDITDLINETTSKDITIDNNSNKNAFIYIIEVE